MERISRHIEYLLLHHDCVIVPGIGAFIARRFPAVMDADGKFMLPPRREIAYNGSVTNDDGLLANSVARKDRVSFEDGRSRVQEYSRSVSRRLREEGRITLGNLGILIKGEEGEISFQPMSRALQNAKAVGKCAVPLYNSSVVISKPELDDRDRKFDTRRYWYIPIHKRMARIAACMMLLFAVSVSLFITPGDGRLGVRHDMASVIPIETLNVKMVPVAVSPVPVETVNLDKDATPLDSEVETEESKGKYCLIIGTFKSQKEVERFTAQITDNVEVIKENKLWRVSLDSSDDRNELISRLSSRQVKENYPGAWVWARQK